MKRMVILLGLCLSVPTVGMADNVGNCGWGSKLFDGQSGVAPQVLAVTTNGTSGNQTFAISSGTSGCTQGGRVRSAWKTAAFIDGNMNRLASDISRGDGESLNSLAAVMGVAEQDKGVFKTTLKENFSLIFSKENVSTKEVVDSMRGVLAANPKLVSYASVV